MSLCVLDTDTLTLLPERHAAVLQRVAACRPDDLAVTVMAISTREETGRIGESL